MKKLRHAELAFPRSQTSGRTKAASEGKCSGGYPRGGPDEVCEELSLDPEASTEKANRDQELTSRPEEKLAYSTEESKE